MKGVILLFLFSSFIMCNANNFVVGQSFQPQKLFRNPLLYSCDFAKDSLPKKHSAHRASIYSAVLPGLGQAYNKKYLKIPVVYVGLGIATYFMLSNRAELKKYKYDINAITDKNTLTNPIYFQGRSLDFLISQRNLTKQYRDYSIIGMGAIYLLNIVDATVDAHFFEFNIDKKLSGILRPNVGLGFYGANLTLSF